MEKKKGDKRDLIIGILVLVVIILLILLICFLVIKPRIQERRIEIYNEAYNKGMEDTVQYLWETISENGYAEIRNRNESMVLAQYAGEYAPVEKD